MLASQASRAVDATWEYAVRVSASLQASPASIKLWWPQDTQSLPSSYAVYRKSKEATSWGAAIALPGRTTSYTDTNVTAGGAFGEQIVTTTPPYKSKAHLSSP